MRRHRIAATAAAVLAALTMAGCKQAGNPPPPPASQSVPPGTVLPTAPYSSRTATAGSSSPAPATTSSLSPVVAGIVPVHDPGQVTGTLTGPCHAADNGRLPDPRCTPGSYDPAVTQAKIHRTICVIGYTVKIRPPEAQTERFKLTVAYPAYGVPAGEKSELDHLVPLELGGSNDARNLWPEQPPDRLLEPGARLPG